jgi:hypothetical protein
LDDFAEGFGHFEGMKRLYGRVFLGERRERKRAVSLRWPFISGGSEDEGSGYGLGTAHRDLCTSTMCIFDASFHHSQVAIRNIRNSKLTQMPSVE